LALNIWDTTARVPPLFLRLFDFVRLLEDKCLNPRGFLLEPICEIVRAVLEEDDEAKGKENKEGQPKEAAKQRHRPDRRAAKVPGQCTGSGQTWH
jgi:hypothetical protein